MRNAKAVFSVVAGLAALGVCVAGAVLARVRTDIGLTEAGIAVGIGALLALVALSLARRARFDYQRTLGRIGGSAIASTGRLLGTVALLVGITAGLAFGVFAVLTIVLD